MSEIASPLLTGSEACDYMKLRNKTRIQTFTTMCRRGDFGSYAQKIGKEWRVHIKGLENFFIVNPNKKTND